MNNFFRINIKNNLLVVNFLLVFFLILFFNVGLLPLEKLGDFIFFVALFFVFSLYRPGWAFLFFIGTIALEKITLIPQEMGLMLRPYQLLAFLVSAAIIIRFFMKRLNFSLPKPKWHDAAILLIGFASLLSVISAPEKLLSLKLAIIVFSFIFLYFLTRIFIQDIADVSRIMPFFLGSSLIVAFFGIWQNIYFLKGQESFEIMAGRPNATFNEPDWLGIYLVLVSAMLYALIYYLQKTSNTFLFPISNKFSNFQIFKTIFIFIFLVFIFTALILTVSRSAWLGTGIATLVFLVATLFSGWKMFLKHFALIVLAGLISLATIYIFNLTSFQLFNRAVSTGGLQKITLACSQNIALPEKISDLSELEKYNCKHINLEDIKKEKEAGNFVKEISRPDPNVNIRAEIYQKSWQEIKTHPILGIGWGSIGGFLGKDERGVSLNSSNIFLEIWLGSGILGFIAFLSVWIYIFGRSVYKFFTSQTEQIKIFSLFIAISWLGITVANLFNAGILLGFMWVYLAVGLIDYKKDENRY